MNNTVRDRGNGVWSFFFFFSWFDSHDVSFGSFTFVNAVREEQEAASKSLCLSLSLSCELSLVPCSTNPCDWTTASPCSTTRMR